MPDELTPLERAVIAVSRDDPAWSLVRQTPLARWVRGRFGPLPLANPKLEALRRYVILSRLHPGALDEQEYELLSDAGYDQERRQEIDQILAQPPVGQSSPRQILGQRRRPMFEPTQPWAGLAPSAPRFSPTGIPAFLPSITTGLFMRHPTLASPQAVTAIAILSAVFWHGAAHAQAQPAIAGPMVGPAIAEPMAGGAGERAKGVALRMEPIEEPTVGGGERAKGVALRMEPIEEPTVGAAGEGPPNGPGGGDHIAIGAGVAYMPAYIGSDKYRAQPLPAIDIKYGRFFVNFQDGIGATLIDNETLTIGAGVVMADNYRTKDAPRGIGNLPFGAGARGFVKLRQFGFEAVLGGTKIFAGSTKGFVADASLSYPIMINERFMLAPSIGTTWGDRKHLNRYFGVNAQQATASGLRQYSTGSGFIDAKAEIHAMYRLTDRISLGAAGGVTTLVGDIKNSPIVKEKTRPFGLMFVSYEF